jgi:acyl-CoA synthetase (AMP-forming)/AMP-acid ligase II
MSSGDEGGPTPLEASLDLGVPPERLTLGAFLADVTDRYAGRTALVSGPERWTYARLGDETRRVARALIAAGVTKGTRVGVLMGNRPELAATLFAVGAVGGVAVPMSTFAAPPERDHVLAHCDAALAVFQARLASNTYLADLARDHPEVVGAPPGRIRAPAFPFLRRVVGFGGTVGELEGWDEFLARGEDVDDALLRAATAAVVPYDDAVMIYTSGTTALPKSVLHLHRSVTGQLWRWGGQLGLTEDDRVWSAFPFFWSAGFAMVLGGTLACGATLYVDEVFDPASVLELIEREKMTTYAAFPHTDALLADHPDAQRRDLTSLRNIRSASALYRFTGRTPEETSWDVSAGYGSSETFTVSTALPNDAPLSLRLSSHGLPLTGMRIRIVDTESGAPLPPGESGEITVKGVYLMRTYYKVAPEACLDDEGWFHTQDAGHLDEQGYLHWHGRISGMIKTGGSNVSPVEVETRAVESGVLGVVTVIGVPHHLLGEAVVMCAVPLQGTEPDPAAVLAHLRANLAVYKVPRRILFFGDEELRFTASDKVQADLARRLAVERLLATDEDGDWVAYLKTRGPDGNGR